MAINKQYGATHLKFEIINLISIRYLVNFLWSLNVIRALELDTSTDGFFFLCYGNLGGRMLIDPGPALQHLFQKWYLVQKLEIKLQIKF